MAEFASKGVAGSGLCGDDQYVFLKSANVMCGVDNEYSSLLGWQCRCL